ncbi:carbohydrate ABC transporter permease [Microbacterium oxydans]|uniref:Trehalose transport system permease protein SugB n=1 Tax=Microbacterium oxydans TaxID=82380 RepID=A0A0F0LGX9_9MICO|nr:carbohydrate ABC transporter permease [Microbacterium oxydans]KJL32487.1 Trehalose transport system permease protein SugB [Microbacterium oxydans]
MTAHARRRPRGWFWTILTVAILIVYLFPVYWMVSASLQPGANSTDTEWFPSKAAIDGYIDAFENGGLDGLRVSLITAFGSVLLTLIVAVPAAYALSRLRSRAVSLGLVLLLLAQMIPSIVLANSFYAMFNTWGVLNSYIGLILANSTAGIPFAIILLRSFMLRLDTEVIEAATLDGLGPLGALWRVVVPLSRNAIITAGVFTFLFSWGDLLFGLTLVTKTDMYPVTVFIYALANSNLNTWAATMAASLIASLPALVLVLAAQRYVKEGVITGSGR